MSFTKIEVRNFQSLKQLDLDLGIFTVIVGPSSSGKSALIRAFRALASNVRGTTMITRGQKQMAITGTTDSGVKVTLERGERSSAYRLSGQGQQQFTKLAGEVPQQVSDILRLDPGADSINFAGQFDKPYLLDESGATIARQLSELTNVNQIFEAVRSANRIRTSTQSTLRMRTGDLDAVRTHLKDFSGLSEHLKSFALIEAIDKRRKALQDRLRRLEAATRRLRLTEAAMQTYKPIEVPSGAQLTEAYGRYLDVRSRAMRLAAQQHRAQEATEQFLEAQNTVGMFAGLLREKLAEAKVCPTCGQALRYLE